MITAVLIPVSQKANQKYIKDNYLYAKEHASIHSQEHTQTHLTFNYVSKKSEINQGSALNFQRLVFTS